MRNLKLLQYFMILMVFIAGLSLGSLLNLEWKITFYNILPIVIAGLALFTTIYQTWATQKHNRLQVRPLITLEFQSDARPSLDGLHCLGFALNNTGLGPANISSVNYYFNNERVDSHKLVELIFSETEINWLHNNEIIDCKVTIFDLSNGTYLKEDTSIKLINIEYWPGKNASERTPSDITPLFESLKNLLLEKLNITLKFSSIYDDDIKELDSKKQMIS
ncbi:hypothetical protein [Aeromonas veronii]|uniref:hypothetical protein n=1 Tax=Aeromonas veronii TaxID=654 RepID=UPI0015E74B9B|nr:hypothetical protein [Aeromonas veronii]